MKLFRAQWYAWAAVVLFTSLGCNAVLGNKLSSSPQVFSSNFSGLLRANPANPRYFADASGKAIYLTGSHTWTGLMDRGSTDPPVVFDFNRYLDLLQSSHHNFIRLWSRHVTLYRSYGIDLLYSAPMPWVRSGPGQALDGKPKFNLSRFDDGYFIRLRERVLAAANRGIYVSIMLFGGSVAITEWPGNPLNDKNNINGINGDSDNDGKGDTQILPLPSGVDSIQKVYVRKVIDTIGDLDNVLFEISNESESSSVEWQFQLIRFIKDYEAGRLDGVVRKQHPVGMTSLMSADNTPLQRSPADWISPAAVSQFESVTEPYVEDPPAAEGPKVSILDSDHLFFRLIHGNPEGGRQWVWKSFLRGHNPILMENLFSDSTGRAVPVTTNDRGFIAARAAMGHTRRYAEKIDLVAMAPSRDLCSTGYALSNPGIEYLAYQPSTGAFTVDLVAGLYAYEWFDPSSGTVADIGTLLASGGHQEFIPPINDDAVLYLKRLDLIAEHRELDKF